MKTPHLVILASAVTLLSACLPSVNPFYRDQDVCFDARLVGRWQEKGNTNDPESWEFADAGNKRYKLTFSEKDGKTGSFNARLFKLKEDLFLDIVPMDCHFAPDQADVVGWAMFPGHLLVRVPQLGPELKLAFCDFDWLSKELEAHPAALTHHLEDKRILLTATTRDLQRFVLNHRGEGQLFQKTAEFVRATEDDLSTERH